MIQSLKKSGTYGGAYPKVAVTTLDAWWKNTVGNRLTMRIVCGLDGSFNSLPLVNRRRSTCRTTGPTASELVEPHNACHFFGPIRNITSPILSFLLSIALPPSSLRSGPTL